MPNNKIALVLLACAAVSCSHEGETRLIISASRPEAVRTVLNDDRTVSFTEGDCISVIDGGGSVRKFTSETVYEDGSADFLGSIITPADDYVAIYPHNSSYTFYGSGVLLCIPDVQTATADSFDPAANISIGRTESIVAGTTALQLRNVCALVKFSVPEGTSYGGAVLVTGYDYLTGQMVCSADDASLSPTGDGSSSMVTLDGNIAGGHWYYFAVSPATLSNGLALYLFDGAADAAELENYSTIKSTTRSITLERSMVLNLGIVGAEPGASFNPIDGETTFEW